MATAPIQPHLPPRAQQRRRSPIPLRPCAPAGSERGSVAAQVVIAIPLLVLLVLLIVQFALAAYADHIAQGAADQALDTARTLHGTDADGQAQAHDLLAQLGNGPLTAAHVNVARDATTVTVTITGTAENIVPGLTLRVHAEASGPIEAFTPDTP